MNLTPSIRVPKGTGASNRPRRLMGSRVPTLPSPRRAVPHPLIVMLGPTLLICFRFDGPVPGIYCPLCSCQPLYFGWSRSIGRATTEPVAAEW